MCIRDRPSTEVRLTALAWPMTLTFNPLRATCTCMQKFKISGQSVLKTEWKQMDGCDCITFHANAVGNNVMTTSFLPLMLWCCRLGFRKDILGVYWLTLVSLESDLFGFVHTLALITFLLTVRWLFFFKNYLNWFLINWNIYAVSASITITGGWVFWTDLFFINLAL